MAFMTWTWGRFYFIRHKNQKSKRKMSKFKTSEKEKKRQVTEKDLYMNYIKKSFKSIF